MSEDDVLDTKREIFCLNLACFTRFAYVPAESMNLTDTRTSAIDVGRDKGQSQGRTS